MSRESAPSPGRIVSMDQFRGFTVAGMFLVNFVGGYAAFAEVLKHHSDRPYFSYADTIMPSFMFAAGFSFRLSALRRLAQIGPAQTYWKFFVRSLGLVLVSMVLFGPGDFAVKNWAELQGSGTWKFIGELIKANLWETLAIIGVTQIFLLPVIGASSRVRAIALGACALVHVVISHWFNFFFVYGQPNWLDDAARADRVIGLGRWLLRHHRLVNPDALRHPHLRPHDQPEPREGGRDRPAGGRASDGRRVRAQLPGHALRHRQGSRSRSRR